MRRFEPPFNGKQFLLNKNTGEIHDLDKETQQCHIDSIDPEHIFMGDSYMECEVYYYMDGSFNVNGCHYCLPTKDNG